MFEPPTLQVPDLLAQGKPGGTLPAITGDNQVIQSSGGSWVARAFVALGAAPAASGDIRLSDGFDINVRQGGSDRNLAGNVGTAITFGDSSATGWSQTNLAANGTVRLVASGGAVAFTVTNLISNLFIPLAINSGGTPATTGVIRLPNNQYLQARNFAGTADLTLIGLNTSNIVDVGSTTSVGTKLRSAILLPDVATSAVAPPAGGAGALPATPAGYVTINIAGTNRQIPYY